MIKVESRKGRKDQEIDGGKMGGSRPKERGILRSKGKDGRDVQLLCTDECLAETTPGH